MGYNVGQSTWDFLVTFWCPISKSHQIMECSDKKSARVWAFVMKKRGMENVRISNVHMPNFHLISKKEEKQIEQILSENNKKLKRGIFKW